MASSFKLKGQWKRVQHLLDPKRFEGALVKHVRRATEWNARALEKEIRARIRGGRYAANAKLTVALKGSSKPVVDDGLLFQSVTTQMEGPYRAFVGVLRKSERGKDMADVALIVHEGATVPVTPAMRGLFFALARATAGAALGRDERGRFQSKAPPPPTLRGRAADIYAELPRGARIKPLRPGTTAIVIQGRPFLREPFEDPAIMRKLKSNWESAVHAALTGGKPRLVG